MTLSWMVTSGTALTTGSAAAAALDTPPAAVSSSAQWIAGDPSIDIDGDPRPNVDGGPDYAGADVP